MLDGFDPGAGHTCQYLESIGFSRDRSNALTDQGRLFVSGEAMECCKNYLRMHDDG
jgi:hypothetical protein